MKNNVNFDEKVRMFIPLHFHQSSPPLARIESLKKGNGIMVVRSPTLPALTPLSNRLSQGGTRSEISETYIVLIRSSLRFSLLVDSGNNSNGNENADCSICMDRPRNSVIRSCNHFVTCYECARLLYNRKDPCPVCRKRIDDVIRVYT